ncbi:MAG: hypothetical protein AABZ30_09480, partial [Myxococcota bacterium]
GGALQNRAHAWILVRPRSDRARDPASLLPLAPAARVASSLRDALATAERVREGRLVLVVGSTYLVGEARELLLGEASDPLPLGDPGPALDVACRPA